MILLTLQVFYTTVICHEILPSINEFSSYQKNLLADCPDRPNNRNIKILIDNDYTYFSGNLVYGCKNHFQRKLSLFNSIILIYHSKFDSTRKESSIYFSYSDMTVPYLNNYQVDIKYCTFDNCDSDNGAAIFINSTEVMKQITISHCQFTNLNATNQGGAIFYNAQKDSSKPIDSSIEQTCLSIQNCIFKITTSQLSGGAVYINTLNCKTNRAIEIKNCLFDHCNVSDVESGDGGAIYIISSEGYRRFNIVNCSFISCISSQFGGGIYFKASFGNIRDSFFSNNEASKGGNDIYYEQGTTEKTSEKLSIFKNIFQQVEASPNAGISLIYLKFLDVSNFDFDNNQISIANHLNELRVFGYDEAATFLGSIIIKDNSLSPPDNFLYETKNILSEKIDFYTAFSKTMADQKCPIQPENSIVITGQSGSAEPGKIYYSCNEEFGEKEISVTNCILDVYNCTFSKTKSATGGVAIYFIINSNIPTELKGTTKIRNSLFRECESEAIHIESSSASIGIDIISCSFQENKKGAINIKAVFGNIKNNYFLDNSNNGKHLDISYECGIEENTEAQVQKLTISDNTFNLTYEDDVGQDSGAFIYLTFNTKSNIEFTENKIIIDGDLDSVTNLFVFDCPETSEKKGEWIILNNCLSPPNDKFIQSNNVPSDFISDLDTAFQDTCLTRNCPPKSDDSVVLFDGNYKETDIFEKQILYSCGQYLDTLINSNNCKVQIYHCIFTRVRPEELTKLGGAIYISTDRTMEAGLSGPIEIHNSQFYSCENDAGGAFYIKSNDPQRLIDVKECLFEGNKAYSPELSLGLGGSVAIEAIYAQIVECTFKSNQGQNGGSISVKTYKSNKDSQRIEIKGCIFNGNIAESKGGDIFYDYQDDKLTANDDKLSEFCISIENCSFSSSHASSNGGSLSINIYNYDSKTVIIKNCTFKDCEAGKYGGSISFESDYQSQINISDCLFEGSRSLYGSVYNFEGYSGRIENCRFINQKDTENGNIIYYRCNQNYGGNKLNFSIEKCHFLQTAEILSILNFLSKDVSCIQFKENSIVIENNKTAVFSTSYSIMGYFEIEGNFIVPPYDEFIRGPGASTLSASCSRGFTCILPTKVPTATGIFGYCESSRRCQIEGNENDPDFIVISSSEFSKLSSDDDGGAVYLKNCGLQCDNSKFIECRAVNGGGGAIYIKIDALIPSQVTVKLSSFANCQSSYAGGCYVYCSAEANSVEFVSCRFERNQIKSTGKELVGGSALFLAIQNGKVEDCAFVKNKGGNSIKIHNKFDKSLLSDDLEFKSQLSISSCTIEIESDSKSSLYIECDNLKRIFVDVKNCIFFGKLSKEAHHIEVNDNYREIANIKVMHIENCKFSADEKSALKMNNEFVDFNLNRQEFNYKDVKEFKIIGKNRNLSVFYVIVPIIIILIVVFLIFNFKEKIENNNEENGMNPLFV